MRASHRQVFKGHLRASPRNSWGSLPADELLLGHFLDTSPKNIRSKMFHWAWFLVVGTVVNAQASVYNVPEMNADPFVYNSLMRHLIEQMVGNSEIDDQDSYLDTESGSSYVRGLPDKEIPIELPIDYDGIDTPLNPKTSIRDQEYLRHSTLWSHSLKNFQPNDRPKIKPGVQAPKPKSGKPENQLPAYCTPPNPCPVGYTSENECIEDFENSAGFSRDYQSAQDCMCDSEHMLECPSTVDSEDAINIDNADLNQIVDRFQEDNPFFRGEKLPIAAKKGINVGF